MNHERAAAAPAGLVCLCTVLLLMLPGGAPGDAQAAVGTPVRGREVVAQIPSPLSLEVNPVLNVPIFDSAPYFNLGGGAEIGLAYQIPRSVFYISGGVGYAYEPDQAADALSMVVARAGAGVRFPLGAGVSVRGFASAGYFFAAFNTLSTTGNNPYAAGGLSLQFNLNPMFRLGAGAQYQYYAGLFHGVSAMIFTGIALGNLGGSVEIPTLELRPTFPVFYKHYDDHPIGTMQVRSNLKVPATDVRVQVFIREYMDAAKTVSVCSVLAPGESKTAELYALFTDKVLGITEGTKVAAEITVSYMVDGQSYEDKRVETISVLGRNAMTWDDNRKAAAFVTAKEPQVLNFARSVTSFVRARENRAICDNLQAAIALHEALDLYGMNYTPNPVTPYAEASKLKNVVDFLQFPRETFQYKAGDCSDLSILYSALLQAVGIDAAFITVPGHIYVAVDTCIPVEKAAESLIPESQYIAHKGHVWIPVEITLRHQGFTKAWQLGAKEWNENTLSKQADFYPVQEAWAAYQPVGLPGTEATINVPQSDKILAAYLKEVQQYLDSALAPKVAQLQDQIDRTQSLPAMNSLGVLYAKYGQSDKAESVFKRVLARKAYLPAMLNLGNLYYLNGDWSNALKYYQQAGATVPGNPHVLVALAKVNQEMKNYPEMQKCYDRLKAVDPALASQYAYLGQGTQTGARAAEIEAVRKAVIWEAAE